VTSTSTEGNRGLRFTRVARRVHLWCGLALIPWILLYAVSGWLFNHPTAFAGDTEARRFSVDEAIPGAVAMLPDAEASAAAVIAELTALAPGSVIARSPDRPARYERALSAEGSRDGEVVKLFVDLARGRGSLEVAAPEVEETPEPLAGTRAVEVPGADEASFRTAAEAALVELGEPPTDLEVKGTPRLVFGLHVDGAPWIATYSPKGGSISYARAGEVSVKRTLARLHMTHVYPGRFGPAWVHTLIVDLVAGCLVLWCLTGLVMWWQMRRLRRMGLVVLASALAASVWVLGGVLPGIVG
jgi:hypothetical protein